MNHLHDRIIEISKKHHLSHLGSALTSCDIIDAIYSIKKENEIFINSCAHNSLALYVILEKYYNFDAEKLLLKHGTHCHRDEKNKIYCSGGSLGMGISISVGIALADRTKNVYCLISDGEAFEGVIWEAANVIRRYKIANLKVYCNWNWYSAYSEVEGWMMGNLYKIMPGIDVRVDNVEKYGLKGLSAHYVTL
jgi:transketolase N-terminal domain/subunit